MGAGREGVSLACAGRVGGRVPVGGPMEDWMNLERLRVEGVPMVCLNGALDKVPEKRRRLGSSRLLSAPLCPSRPISAFGQLRLAPAATR